MTVVFMGTPEYANTILKEMLQTEGLEVVSVYTQPDRPVGRKKVLTPPPVKVTALSHGIEVHQPLSLKEEAVADRIGSLSPDFIVVAAYGQLLPKAILDIAPCINLHASLLPKYRGASPIQQALLNGEKVTGVTAMLMEEGLDSGPILAWSVVPIGLDVRKNDLFETMARRAARLTVETLENFSNLSPLPQCDADASYCRKITRADGLVTFDLAAEELYNRFRAYEGWPGVYLSSGLKLLDLSLAAGEGEAGKILRIEEEGVVVACADGALMIRRVQPPSKKGMDALSYIRGKRLGIDDLFV